MNHCGAGGKGGQPGFCPLGCHVHQVQNADDGQFGLDVPHGVPNGPTFCQLAFQLFRFHLALVRSHRERVEDPFRNRRSCGKAQLLSDFDCLSFPEVAVLDHPNEFDQARSKGHPSSNHPACWACNGAGSRGTQEPGDGGCGRRHTDCTTNRAACVDERFLRSCAESVVAVSHHAANA